MMDSSAATEQSLMDVALPVGTELLGDQFTITSILSSGGFGITYRAKDNVLGRTVVIKECFADDFCLRSGKNVVARNQTHDKHFKSTVMMFMREARSLAKVRHANIVGVHRAFEENGTAYMALDLIDGFDLNNILEANATPLPPSGVEDMLLRLLDAVETVHHQDLLHRDISPDNIMIERDGNPVLIDFGAARGDASKRTRAISSLLVVKDGYSPQEFYIAGSIQTPASDLYALAATFYHVLSGEAPPNSQVRTVEVAGQNPDPCIPLSGRIEGYSAAFLGAIDKAMQPLPNDRLQSVDEWLDILNGDLPTPEIEVREAPAAQPQSATPGTSSRPKTTVVSPKLAASLTRLIEETNEEVEKTRLIVVEPEPETSPVDPVSTTPDWVDEFNSDAVSQEEEAQADVFYEDEALNDTPSDADFVNDDQPDTPIVDDAAPADPDGATPDVAVPVTKEEPESDWINRIREKGETAALAAAAEKPKTRVFFSPSKGVPAEETEAQTDEIPPLSELIVPMLKVLTVGILAGLFFIFAYFNLT